VSKPKRPHAANDMPTIATTTGEHSTTSTYRISVNLARPHRFAHWLRVM
jgi:hypothetical protein